MTKIRNGMLVMIVAALLAACGGAEATEPPPAAATVAPTAVVVPTATVAPATATTAPATATTVPATATTVPATATTAPATATTAPPTATAVPVVPTTLAPTASATGNVIKDSSGKCQIIVPPVFVANSGNKDTYATADNLALLTFTGTDTPGLDLAAATGAFVEGFKSVVTSYVETGRQTLKEARGDIQIVTFDGAVSGQQAKGVFYFVQNGGVLCSLVALAVPPGDEKYNDAAQQAAASLKLVQGGTSVAPPVAPTPNTGTTATVVAPVAPTRAVTTATVAAPVAGGTKVLDVSGLCGATLPASFKSDPNTPGNYKTSDNLAIVTLSGSENGALPLKDAANLYVEAFKAIIDGYTETGRQGNKVNNAEELTVTYSGTLVGQPVKGVLYFIQVNTTFCSLSGIVIPPGDTKYNADLQAIVDSFLPVKP